MTNRTISAPNVTAIQEKLVPYLLLVELDFPSQFVRVHNGAGQITFESNIYNGIGDFGEVSLIEEELDSKPRNLKFSLRGVPKDSITDALTEKYHGRSARINLGLLNADRTTFIDTPFEIWSGTMNYIDLQHDGDQCRLVLECMSNSQKSALSKVGRYTLEDQNRLFPGDNFFKFVQGMTNREVEWGGIIFTGGGGGGPAPGDAPFHLR